MESLFSKKFAMATASSLVLASWVRGPSKCHNWSGWTLTVTFYKNNCQSWCMHPTLYSIIYHAYFHNLQRIIFWRYFHSVNLDDLRMSYIACTLEYIFTDYQKCTYILVFSKMMNKYPQQFDSQENKIIFYFIIFPFICFIWRKNSKWYDCEHY